MDQKFTLLAGLLIIALPAITLLQTSQQVVGDRDSVNASFSVNGSQTSWAMLEVADNETERAEGLMNVTDLGRHEGMLFKYQEEDLRGFWMKNTLIPLDMIFVDKNGRIINIEEAHPEPNTSDENLTIYRSEAPAKYVIETNSSFTERKNIEEGDRVEIPTRFQ